MGQGEREVAMPSLTQSPLQLAHEAYCLAKRELVPYSNKFSRQDFTQAQHFALLVLKRFFKVSFRKTMRIVSEWSDLRQALELELDNLPHWTTLEKAEKRLLKKGVSNGSNAESSSGLSVSA